MRQNPFRRVAPQKLDQIIQAAVDDQMSAWVRAEADRLDITVSELVRVALAGYADLAAAERGAR